MTPTSQLSKIFNVDGIPYELSEGQAEIWDEIVLLPHLRTQIIAPTQYGKSLDVGCATLLRSASKGERFTILAPSTKKASIIMGYVIDHVFDDRMFTEQLELDSKETLDRLRRERSRNSLTFKRGGGVQILTLDAKNKKRSIEAAMGFGGNRLILDESSLIDDVLYATVKRMLGGYPYKDTFLLEIGNPFYRNHFYRTWMGNRYHKIFIDYHRALAEGRYSPEFIDEMREEALFEVLYECKFPEEDAVDDQGYRQLLTREQIEAAFVDQVPDEESHPTDMGVDVAGGGDLNTYTMRNDNFAWLYGSNRSRDTMTNVVEIQTVLETEKTITGDRIAIDDIGIGHGVSDRCRELGIPVNAVVAGAACPNKKAQKRFKNIKAEAYWNTKQWIEAGGKIYRNDNYFELAEIKYKVTSDRLIQIEPKEELKKRLGKSPDHAESLMLTFAPRRSLPGIY